MIIGCLRLLTVAALPAAVLPAALGGETPAAHNVRVATTATLPFKVEVIEVAGSNLPAVHSFASATADGKWLILGGRTGGLHGFGSGNDNFPPTKREYRRLCH